MSSSVCDVSDVAKKQLILTFLMNSGIKLWNHKQIFLKILHVLTKNAWFYFKISYLCYLGFLEEITILRLKFASVRKRNTLLETWLPRWFVAELCWKIILFHALNSRNFRHVHYLVDQNQRFFEKRNYSVGSLLKSYIEDKVEIIGGKQKFSQKFK